MELILASTSPYRKQLLKRLGIEFTCEAPEVDETALPGEPPQALARRLAVAKAEAIAHRFPGALVIGSDQVASLDGNCMGKPGNHAAATSQLRNCSGQQVTFYTGLACICADTSLKQLTVEAFTVEFRKLSDREIESYLRAEQPYDCAGSFKCEGLGISLFTRMAGDDPTSLEGLPLIATSRVLREAGFACP